MPPHLLKFYHSRAPISTCFARGVGYDRRMRTIYLDEVFLLNLVIDYFLLLAAAMICALPFRRPRFFLAAACGAAWSASSLLPALAFLRAPIMNPILAAAMTLIAFGRERKLGVCLLAFLGVSALFGGTVYAAGLYRGAWSRSGALVRLDLRVLALSFAVCWAIVSLVFRQKVKTAQRRIRALTLTLGGRSVSVPALEDTGNGLYDPVTGRAALVIEREAAAGLFPRDLRPYLRLDPIDAAVHIPGARLLPYAGVDGKKRLLLAFRPDSVTADGEERDDLLAAVAPDLGGDGSYRAII